MNEGLIERVFSWSLEDILNEEFFKNQIVFSWSLEDILNDDLFKDQVKTISDEFLSAEHYLNSFSFPLLEETRAEIASSLEIIQSSPYAEVISIDESKPAGFLNYEIHVDNWRNKYKERGKYPYRTLPGDIFVISDQRPRTYSDLQRVGWKWAFAHLTEIKEGENGIESSSISFKVKVSRKCEVNEGSKKLLVIFLRNVTTNKRIWKAMHMFNNMDIINRVLSTVDSEVKEGCQLCCVRAEIGDVGASLSSKLNQSQTEAIMASLSRVKCNHKSSINLIWGPPGAGKTKTISVLLFTLLKMNYRTLVCAPTNVAVNEVASRVLKLGRESAKSESVNDAFLYSFGDIVLFGNRDRLKLNYAMQDLYLEYRAESLKECLGPLTGWGHCLTAIIEFLETYDAQYKVYTENITARGEKQSQVESIKERFNLVASDLRRCLRKLCTHLPKRFIEILQNIEALLHCVKSLDMMLFRNTLVSEELEEEFTYEEAIKDSFETFLGTESLVSVKSECLSLSRELYISLEGLRLPNYMNKGGIIDLIFQHASLILCTASSSSMLHSVPIKAVDILVVDEAAQLKECESLIPLQLPGLRHAILVGDECQLPAMVCSNISSDAGFKRSLFERLSFLGHPKHLLNMQYRMHQSISFFPNSKFYSNRISDAPLVKDKGYEKHYLPGPLFGPYSFINVVGGKEEVDDVFQHSLKNLVEVSIVVKLLHDLCREYKVLNGPDELSIGVISPYLAQVVAIKDKIGSDFKNIKGFSVKVKSIDGFQGGEADVIIISTVRSSAVNAIGFLSSPQRINVALTRARYCLWILGNERTLSGSESIWKDLIRDAKDRHSLFNAADNDDMAKAILKVKKEVNQMDDLLNERSVLFKNAIWKVFFSDNIIKSFVKLSSLRTKKAVINLLLKLSQGWRPKQRNSDANHENSSQIMKQFKVEELYVVCTVDIIKGSRSYSQILKLVKRLEGMFAACTDSYINSCREICLKGDLEVPKSWVASADIVKYKLDETNVVQGDETCRSLYVENSSASESLLLMKFYRLSSDMATYLLSDVLSSGHHVDLPFEVTGEQLEMILCSDTTFILGRSGTGKTTVLTMKLFTREIQHYIAVNGVSAEASSSTIHTGLEGKSISSEYIILEGNKSEDNMVVDTKERLCQLFVTVSPRLCYAIKQNITALKRFFIKTVLPEESTFIDMDDTTYFEDLPDSFVGISPNMYPLVITFHKFLMMLDGTIGVSFFERYSDVRELLHDNSTSSRSVALENLVRTKEVTYERFCSVYWVHFNSESKKRLDSSRVFTEIISHIKGGLKDGRVCERILSREDYTSLSKSKRSTLSEEIREKIYEIFWDYEKAKARNREFDLADLVNHLHYQLSHAKFEGQEMCFVYVDEVQDLTLKQIALFKYICKNVDEGFVFAGDTAQTIARGIDFRFQDIRSLFYNEFLKDSQVDRPGGSKVKKNISELLCLKQNFRTHDGVLKLAQSVIDLLSRFFPNIIDILDPEKSLICGEEPVLLEPVNGENAIMTIFGEGGGENVSGKLVGFGAEQVILVRDDCARDEICAVVGKQALVLTIFECKGLEFQDVLLYNFFGSSPLKTQWRVIYGYMEKHDVLDGTGKSFPTFSEEKHNVLCSELKQLYVAITRSRQRLWICESNEELSKPMYEYWNKKSLVQVKKLDYSLAQAMQVSSTPEEWKACGIKLFHKGNYEMAKICFARASEDTWLKWCEAMCLKQTANRVRASNPERARHVLTEAAELYESIGKDEYAAACYYELGEYEKAGNVYLIKCGERKLQKAGECFSLAGYYELAAEAYAKGNHVSHCLSVCSKGKLFKEGLEYIQGWKQLDHYSSCQGSKELGKIKQSFLESCANHYYKLKDTISMMKFVNDFDTIDTVCCYLKKLKCFDELLLVQEKLRNFIEASEIAFCKGDFILEAELLEKAGHFKEASTLMLCYAFNNSLWVFNSKGWPPECFSGLEEILAKAKSWAKKESDAFFEFVNTEVNLLRQEENDLSTLYCYLRASRLNKSLRGEVLSIRKILDIHFHKCTSKFEWENELLREDLVRQCEDKLSHNGVSIGTLVYIWNLLLEKFENVFKHLTCLETQENNECSDYDDFCCSYFGVRRKLDGRNVLYFLINPAAYWVRDIDNILSSEIGKSVYINTHQFVVAARNHFRSEMLCVGLKLLDTLEALHKLAVNNSMSTFCKSTPIIQIFEVTKYLFKSKDLDAKYYDAKELQNYYKKLQNYSDLTSVYFDYVFALDWRKISNENMISLRRSDTSRWLLDEIGIAKLGIHGTPPYGELGGVAMILLGSGNPSKEFSEKILNNEVNTRWIKFFKEIVPKMDYGISDNSSIVTSALQTFFNAIEHAGANCYKSPNCFVYLFEHLWLWLSFTRKSFFTTRSSLVEWIIGGDSYFNGTSSCAYNGVHPLTLKISFSLAKLIEKFMMKGRLLIAVWISRYELDFNQFYPLLMLRLIVTLCLLCLNGGVYFEILLRLLDIDDIASWLPRDFCAVLKRKKGKHYLILNANEFTNIFAEAFSNINDPLVMVSLSENQPKVTWPRVIFVDINDTSCKENILDILFQKERAVFQGQDGKVEATKICNTDNDGQHKKASSSSFASPIDEKMVFTKKQVSDIKLWCSGFETLDQDRSQQLHAALDSGDLGKGSTLMRNIFEKQYALTGDPFAKYMLERDYECTCGECPNYDESRLPSNSGKGKMKEKGSKTCKAKKKSKQNKDGRKK